MAVAPPIALTISGSDCSAGAGLQADLKTFHQHGVYGTSVITLLTVQNTRGVRRVEVMDPSLVKEQIDAVVSDVPPAAAKTGALGSAEVVRVVGEAAERFEFPLDDADGGILERLDRKRLRVGSAAAEIVENRAHRLPSARPFEVRYS